MQKNPKENQKKPPLIATKATLDWAYPPFILASTAAALGYEAQIFFTLLRSQTYASVSVGQTTRLTTASITTRNSMVMMLPARMKSAVL